MIKPVSPLFYLVLLSIFPLIANSQNELLDERDGKRYNIAALGDLYWMTEDLLYSQEQSICMDNCDSIRFYHFNSLASVCPEGWRLPSMDEWNLFTESFKGVEKVRMMEENKKLYRVDFLNQFNLFKENKLNIKPMGRIEGGQLETGPFIDYWTTNDVTDDRFHMHFTPYSIVGHAHKHHLKENKPEELRLFPIRCVCEVSSFKN